MPRNPPGLEVLERDQQALDRARTAAARSRGAPARTRPAHPAGEVVDAGLLRDRVPTAASTVSPAA